MQFFEFESQPDTETKGALGPPRRRPPVAIGVGGTPPRPPDNSDDSGGALEDDGQPYREPSLLRRIGLSLLALQVLLVAAVLLRPLGWQAYLGAGVAGVAQLLWHQARARTMRDLRAMDDRTTRDDNGGSHLRSA